MSNYGFEIKNAANQIVADTNFPVYTPVDSGTFNAGGTANAWTFTDVYFNVGVDISKMPQFFMELPTDVNGYGAPTICLQSYLMSGTLVTGVRIHSYFYNISSSIIFPVNYIVAVPVSATEVQSGDYGIIAYDKYGAETFNSGKRIVTIKQVGTIEVNEYLYHDKIEAKRYVAISGLGGIKVTPVQYPYYGYVFYVGVRHESDTSISLRWNLVALNATTINAEWPIPVSLIVAELSL